MWHIFPVKLLYCMPSNMLTGSVCIIHCKGGAGIVLVLFNKVHTVGNQHRVTPNALVVGHGTTVLR